jgi:hypothetical protein
MSLLQPSPMFFLHRSPSVLSDVEMLQTDVMRFFAILCLCLMAIFALVKALPMAPLVEGPTISEPADLKTAAKSLQKQIAALKDKLAETQIQLQKATDDAEQSSARTVRAAKTEQAVLARIVKAKQELEKVSQTLSDTRRQIEVREMKLAKIVKDIVEKRRVRAELKTQIENETRNLTKIRGALDRVQIKLDRRLQQNQEPPKKLPETTFPPEPEKKGFTLRFSSDDALKTLISSGKVNFYAIAGQKAWQFMLSGGRPVYIATKLPREIYEMETPTVPVDFAAVFQRQIAAFGRDTVTWGVTLPAQTTASIKKIVQGRKGGDLVITADGKVKLN